MKQTFFLIFILSSLFSLAQVHCDPQDFELLKRATAKPALTEDEFTAYLETVRKLESNMCIDYVQKKNGQDYVETGLTYLLGRLCLLSNSRRAVEEYVGYLKRNSGSAEEQRSFSFEYLFRQNPAVVLSVVQSDKELLDHLVWGFINNRRYGVNDPYESEPNKAYSVEGKAPKPFLTQSNCQDIFYKTYPILKNNKSYSKQIAYLLSSIREDLKEQKK